MTPLIVLLALAATTIAALGYATLCYLSPFGRCRRCRARWGAQPWCRRCDGTGHRVRIGIRAWQAWTRTTRDAFHNSTTNPTPATTTPSTTTTPPSAGESSPEGSAER